MRVQVGQERGNIGRIDALGQSRRFPDQAPTATLADSDMAEHAALSTQTRGTSRHRDRIVVPVASHHQMLEQAPDRCDPPVQRCRRRALQSKNRHLAGRRTASLLPSEIVEQIARLDLRQPQQPLSEEAPKLATSNA